MLRMNKTCAISFSLCVSCFFMFFSCFAMAHFFNAAAVASTAFDLLTTRIGLVLLHLIWLQFIWFAHIVHAIIFPHNNTRTAAVTNRQHICLCNSYTRFELLISRFILVGLPHWTCTLKQIISKLFASFASIIIAFYVIHAILTFMSLPYLHASCTRC